MWRGRGTPPSIGRSHDDGFGWKYRPKRRCSDSAAVAAKHPPQRPITRPTYLTINWRPWRMLLACQDATNKTIVDNEVVFLMEQIAGTNRTVDGFYDTTTHRLPKQPLSDTSTMALGMREGAKQDNTIAHGCISWGCIARTPHLPFLICKSISLRINTFIQQPAKIQIQ